MIQISRLFETVYLLLDRGSMTAGELSRHFEVSTRTVYRDVETLSLAGIPIYAAKGRGGGIRLTENFVLNKSVLTDEEQKKILQSLQGMHAVREEEAQPVLSRLSALFGGEAEDWIEVEFSAWNRDHPVSQSFELLKKAIFARRLVIFCYSSADGRTGRRLVEPLKLVFRASQWYLYAFCTERQDFRFFKLCRMEDLTVTGETFKRRPVPDLWKGNGKNPAASEATGGDRKNPAASEATGGDGKNPAASGATGGDRQSPTVSESAEGEEVFRHRLVTVTVEVGPQMAYRVLEEFDKKALTRQPDGSFLAELVLPEDDWLIQYLLSFGSHLKVRSPERIRMWHMEELRKALREYGE